MLKRVSIQNFKSLKDVTLDLQKINLLIGPNNSGKTNFFKALEYIKANYRSLPQSKDKELTFERNGLPIHFLITDDSDTPLYVEIPFDFDSDKFLVITKDKITFAGDGVVPFIPGQSELESLFKSTTIYKPDPNKLIKPGPTGLGVEIINSDTSNLIGFLDRMLGNKYRKTVFNRIENDLQKCIPEFDGISIDDTPSTDELLRIHPTGKTFKKLGLINSKQDITYWADELSEGTLYFLALLCIINQPNPPKLLLLEEPEKGIHPRRIEEVINFIFRLADEKDIQVIMTTHSPAVVDMFGDMPESVFIFDKDDEGATHVKNLQKDIIEPETAESERAGFDPPHYLNGLGEAWKVGLIGGVPR